MNNIKSVIVSLLSLITVASYAQQSRCDLGAPTDLKAEGFNKVLCMKNGSTLLFHFESRKAIVVKVFDSSHKEIASQKHLCGVLDINAFDRAMFKGLYDIKGEAVLFVEQEHQSKKQLVRLRFSGSDGKLLEEMVAGESKSVSEPSHFLVMKNRNEENYSILFAAIAPQYKKCAISVTYYNDKHQVLRDVPIDINMKEYDNVEVVSAESQPNGTCVTLDLMKLVTNGTVHSDNITDTRSTYDHTMMIAYIPANSIEVRKKLIDLSIEHFPFYANYTYNPFAQSLNVLLFNYKEFLKKVGLDVQPTALQSTLLFNVDQSDMSLKYNWMKNQLANVYYKQQTDTTKLFDGIPIKMFTNENGLSTIISEAYTQFHEVESHARPNVFESYFGKIGITQCDDEGKELWGVVLPGAQFLKSYRHYYNVYEMSKRWQEQYMFDDMPPQVYERQFVSINTYTYHNNYYVIFNDYNKNFNNTITRPGDTVYSFDNTNAVYYKLGRKKEITKNYLFGEPLQDEYKCSFIQGADFDEDKGVYATLVQCKKNKDITLCMAWCHLD